ncbi:MAG: hypothetical protein ACTSWI_02455 [Alphaproteobacteria bacterium]
MFRIAAALGAAMVIALVASAVRGQAQNVDGRFQLTAEDDGFLRLDTQTGALSFCQLEDGRWACAPVETEDAPDFNLISDRITALEAALVELAARLERPDTAVRVQLEAITAQLEGLIEIGAGTPEIADQLSVLTVRLDEIEGRLAGIDQAGGEGGAALIEISALLEIIVERQREIGGEIGALVATINAAEGVTPIELVEELAPLREWQTATDFQLAGLFEAINRLGESISSRLAEAVAPLDERQIAFELQLAGLELAIEEIAPVGAEFVGAIAAVEERQMAIEGRLVALTEAIEAGDLLEEAFVTEAFEVLQREMGNIRVELVGISDSVAAQIATLVGEIEAVNARIGALPAPVDLAADLARIESELLALRDLLTEPAATSPEGDGIEPAPDDNAAAPDDADTLADKGAAGFGEQLFLRLDDLVGDLRRGLRGE